MKKVLAGMLLIMLLSCAGCVRHPADKNAGDPGLAETTSTIEWDDAAATHIALDGERVTVDGQGASADGAMLTISRGGVYVLSGTLSGGQVVVEAGDNDLVQVVLNGVDITSRDGAAIHCIEADKLMITLASGTDNTIADVEEYVFPDAQTDEPDAAVFSNKDMEFNGAGSLHITAKYNNGIGTKDDLIIESGNYEITAVNHGIRGRDSVTVLGGAFSIQSGGDGIQANNDSGEGKGWIRLEDGTFHIVSANDGIQAETALSISGGSYTIESGGGHESREAAEGGSYKGIKAGGDMTVSGGVFTLNCADDAIHSNANVTISGGTWTCNTGDDGMHADAGLTISSGDIQIPACYEGLEGASVTISGGAINIAADNDAINAAGGADGDAGGRFGQDTFSGAAGGDAIHISGGLIVLRAQGDGLDSNADIQMSGGEVYVDGPDRDTNAAIDYDGVFTMTGGLIVASGSSKMAQGPGEGSAQPSLMLYYSAGQQANTKVEILDEAGSVLASFTPQKEYRHIVISAPGMKQGKPYTVTSNGDTVVTVELSGMVTRITDQGEAVQEGRDRPGTGQGDGERPDKGG